MQYRLEYQTYKIKKDIIIPHPHTTRDDDEETGGEVMIND